MSSLCSFRLRAPVDTPDTMTFFKFVGLVIPTSSSPPPILFMFSNISLLYVEPCDDATVEAAAPYSGFIEPNIMAFSILRCLALFFF